MHVTYDVIYICAHKALQNILTETWHVDNQKHNTYNDLVKRSLVKLQLKIKVMEEIFI